MGIAQNVEEESGKPRQNPTVRVILCHIQIIQPSGVLYNFQNTDMRRRPPSIPPDAKLLKCFYATIYDLPLNHATTNEKVTAHTTFTMHKLPNRRGSLQFVNLSPIPSTLSTDMCVRMYSRYFLNEHHYSSIIEKIENYSFYWQFCRRHPIMFLSNVQCLN